MLISAKVRKVQPAIAQLEERRFVIGNRSLTTLGPVFESRWLDPVLLPLTMRPSCGGKISFWPTSRATSDASIKCDMQIIS